VGNPNDTAETEDDTTSSVEYARFKREVYHKICDIIFASVRRRSHSGEAVICGDNITRVLFPGVLINAVDMEEAYCMCGTRGVQANYPCPRCLIHKSELHRLTMSFTLRTQQRMKTVYEKALTYASSAAEKLLKGMGLHLVEVCCTARVFTAL